MKIIFDEDKNLKNIEKHNISLNKSEEFEFDNAIFIEDKRKNYGEERWISIGNINERLHVLIFTYRANKIRVISLRKANIRERKIYEQKRQYN